MLLEYGKEVENLSFELYSWYKILQCKKEDFIQVVDFQNEATFLVFKISEAVFSRHVEFRSYAEGGRKLQDFKLKFLRSFVIH